MPTGDYTSLTAAEMQAFQNKMNNAYTAQAGQWVSSTGSTLSGSAGGSTTVTWTPPYVQYPSSRQYPSSSVPPSESESEILTAEDIKLLKTFVGLLREHMKDDESKIAGELNLQAIIDKTVEELK